MKMLKTLLLPVLFMTSAAQAQPLLCRELFQEPTATFAKAYPHGVDPVKNPGGYMQIGYESEYLFSESAALLRDYAPAPQVMPKEQWLAMSDEGRITWLKGHFLDKPEFAAASGLFKQVATPYMPNELIVDSTGNVEIVLAPFDTYGQWEQAINEIAARYGVGSQQAMISKPRESAFGPRAEVATKTLVDQSLGWLVYTNLRDMFAKLDSGAARYKKDRTKLTAQFLEHPFLGPMTKMKRETMERYLSENAEGRMYDEYSKRYVSKRDISFKYTGGPSYRPDVAAPVRFSWEIRNAHKDLADLKMKVRRDLVAHEEGLESYQAFAGVPAFDSMGLFARFDEKTQASLVELFPTKADPRFNYPQDDRRALEVYRNFSLPLQDFTALGKALTSSAAEAEALESHVARARFAYIHNVYSVAENFRAGHITRDQARAEIMGEVCLWAKASGLAGAFQSRAVHIGHEPARIAG